MDPLKTGPGTGLMGYFFLQKKYANIWDILTKIDEDTEQGWIRNQAISNRKQVITLFIWRRKKQTYQVSCRDFF